MQGNGTRDLKTLTLQIDVVDFECRNLEQTSLRASGQKSNTGIRFSEAFSPCVEFHLLISNVMHSLTYFVPVVEQRLVLLSTCLGQLTLSLSLH